MDAVETKKALALLASRLTTLSGILDKAESAAGSESLDDLAAARLAEDMHPLAWQVSAVCTQAQQFLDWCHGGEQPNVVGPIEGWSAARGVLADTLAKISAAEAEGIVAPAEKRITIAQMGVYVDLTAQRYLDDWILPNLYFHLSIAYAVLRMKGAPLGKAEFMQHIVGDLRPIPAEARA
ncbi:DUF1993 domain-containing protein [Novosphingobium sp. P6W]|uniref:DUF1993 family protein n=1 Tax=Novosphingobium sp. P6W TaxID=1609758 RepID=UPI0005C2CBC6|nr:DUF1993 domain-containing protein [Novosphingobium sp. P6W]AXB76304.1 DUF1993 domain-containing protein [Novosphingobium sp. P6W]KIS32188.1 hypothetical protein TQ38_13685 [Novosphingobium sp. P6W]